MSELERIADQDQAFNLGREHTDHAWICSDRDVWYPNPLYTGPLQPHPEDDDASDYIEEHGIDAWRELKKAQASRTFHPSFISASPDCEIPF